MPLACEECDRVTDDARGWIAKVVGDDDELDTQGEKTRAARRPVVARLLGRKA